ncbi:AraC family transcriptional regulator, partial [archaeon]
HLAQHALRQENAQVSTVAQSLGYTSESAFSNAFKRVMGQAPKRYQREAAGGEAVA